MCVGGRARQPEEAEAALEADGPEGGGGDADGHDARQHQLVQHLGQQVGDGQVQPVRALAHVQLPLQHDRRHCGQKHAAARARQT